jgi:hypothetical protein
VIDSSTRFEKKRSPQRIVVVPKVLYLLKHGSVRDVDHPTDNDVAHLSFGMGPDQVDRAQRPHAL